MCYLAEVNTTNKISSSTGITAEIIFEQVVCMNHLV